MQAKIFISVSIAFIFLALSAPISADLGNMDKAEAQAKTKFDHIGLAEMYEKEANEMNTKVEEQRKLLQEYEEHSEYYGREGQDFHSHHEALLRKYMKAVERNKEMAASHRKMAGKNK
ncbi:hypothetical protein ABF87_05800 [Nitrosomonas sp. JL21]|nr:hypothetical protein [Nitrosomonas sp.]MXS77483.1 hypothetical protein [Nitrosomonas sp. JL21]